MLAPCEYCGCLIDADVFMRLGIAPCCPGCANEPFWRGVVWSVFSLVCLGLCAWALLR